MSKLLLDTFTDPHFLYMMSSSKWSDVFALSSNT